MSTSTGADPDELLASAADGPGQAFALDHRARWLDLAGARYRARNPHGRVDVLPAVRGLRSLATRIVALDRWVGLVAAALLAADHPALRLRLLGLGPGHVAAEPLVGPLASARLPVRRLTGAELDRIAGWPGLPVPWRDRVHRERARRWVAAAGERVAAVPEPAPGGPLDRLARWVDDALVDRLSPVVDLHVTAEEQRARLRAEADGLHALLARPDLALLSFTPRSSTPRRGPAVRVALGDVAAARRLVLLLPGTSTGLHAHRSPLADAASLHAAMRTLAPDERVATVLDLYDAPVDLGRAADPATGAAAGAATATFLTRLLDDRPGPRPATTVVGHSYGAFTAARVAQAAPDQLAAVVLLGAPGAGVQHRDELGLPPTTEVWAARAPGDPIGVVADLDELLAALPDRLRPTTGPLAEPAVALGPDPTDPEFGARRLPVTASAGSTGHVVRGHLDYLAPGSASVRNVARVALGLPVHGVAGRISGGSPPTRDPPGTAAAD